jgi:hypothetical protein
MRNENEIKTENGNISITKCPFKKENMVGSIGCALCAYYDYSNAKYECVYCRFVKRHKILGYILFIKSNIISFFV